MTWFDEARLDDERALAGVDPALRRLAESGARVRREVADARAAGAGSDPREDERPRAVIAAGPDSRLLRAVLEPWCPVPFVAWPYPGLPGWAGGLDLVVMLAPEGSDVGSASAVAEAVRRGCRVVVACPDPSLVAEHAQGRWTTLLPTTTGDQLATAVVMLGHLEGLSLGPATAADEVADSLDRVAVDCSPYRDLAVNPAKALAIALADSTPLVWGGSVLAARAARRVSEALRRATGRNALAGDAERLLPVLEAARPRDTFDDPYADDGGTAGGSGVVRPSLLVLDDGTQAAVVDEDRRRLEEAAQARGLRVEAVGTPARHELARYASLVLTGSYLAQFLALGAVAS